MCNPGARLDFVSVLSARPSSTEEHHLEIAVLVRLRLFSPAVLVQNGNRHGGAVNASSFFAIRNALHTMASCFIEQAVQCG